MRKCAAALLMLLVMLLSASCGNAGTAYTDYVQAVLDCTYLGETDEYHELTGAPTNEAALLQVEEEAYVTDLLCYNLGVDTDLLPEETYSAFLGLSKELMSRLKYTVSPAVNANGIYQVTVTVYPMNLWDNVIPQVEGAYQNGFSERFAKAPEGSDEFAEVMADWGKRVLDLLTNQVLALDYLEPVTVTVPVTADEEGHSIIADSYWQKIDDLLLDNA